MHPLTGEVQRLLDLGWDKARIARHLGISRPKVQRIERKLKAASGAAGSFTDSRDIHKTSRFADTSHDVELRVPRLIQTEAEALAASEIDLTVWTPTKIEIRHYPIPTADGVVQGSYVKIGCVKKNPHTTPDALEAAVERGVAAGVGLFLAARPPIRYTRPRLLRTRIITDLHIGGYAWCKSTGGDNWDIHTALTTATASNGHLDAQVPDEATETLLAFLGDLAHFDTPKGTTTGGTQLDLDSRVDLMLEALTSYAVETVAREAERRPVTVLMVPGNHDNILARALRRLLITVFKPHRNVTVLEQYTPRQYHRFGDTLLGFTHGDGNRERIAAAMAHECGNLRLWDGAKCRELHLGHVHHESAKQKTLYGTESLRGVVVRTHVALTAQDQYHTDEAWVGSTRGMSDYYYHHDGALVQTTRATPHLLGVA